MRVCVCVCSCGTAGGWIVCGLDFQKESRPTPPPFPATRPQARTLNSHAPPEPADAGAAPRRPLLVVTLLDHVHQGLVDAGVGPEDEEAALDGAGLGARRHHAVVAGVDDVEPLAVVQLVHGLQHQRVHVQVHDAVVVRQEPRVELEQLAGPAAAVLGDLLAEEVPLDLLDAQRQVPLHQPAFGHNMVALSASGTGR